MKMNRILSIAAISLMVAPLLASAEEAESTDAAAEPEPAVVVTDQVVASRRLPSRWPRDWELSDHIPVCATFRWQRAVRGR